ncbi:hypothetical protein CWI80_06915 [Pseudidiomarina sediminum]|uniref:Uncharacterized protein n=1 Tax=Pseudidiomarina sediminum TaxID=431675 RepID=A0A432ZAW4_9GAMM|nr:hypothetical protein [Pseudidiomarina sediminum]RUO75051.1 hypothetical protein CWI80_06915 [Pseudidiomarina sediminum]
MEQLGFWLLVIMVLLYFVSALFSVIAAVAGLFRHQGKQALLSIALLVGCTFTTLLSASPFLQLSGIMRLDEQLAILAIVAVNIGFLVWIVLSRRQFLEHSKQQISDNN